MKIRVEVPPDGGVTIKAIDLAGDCWADYLSHLEQAACAERVQELHGKNRALRAGLISLSAHFEGVIDKVFCSLKRSQGSFRPPSKSGIKSRALALERAAQSLTASSLPPLPMKFKLLRDILAPPGITKGDLEDHDLYDLTAEDLRDLGTAVGCWLDALCNAYKVPRFEDTEAEVRALGEVLGGMPTPPKKI